MEDDQVITTTETNESENKPTKWLIIIAVLVLVLGGGYYLSSRSKRVSQTPERQYSETAEGGVPDNRVIVSDYSPGDTLSVAVVRLAQPGFVVVHEDNEGTPGEVIGVSALLTSGERNDVSVSLDREIKEGEAVHVMLHGDDGDEEFSLDSDNPLTDDEGTVVAESFLVGAGED